ncbi:hypothetical protein ERX46_05570 [Brumimicrobium glaciale]|uniref:Uncharacterized protein n=1 Tax=Brumimicrobium glaciale TaxID=200475 RepID=A0A4Q4KQI6_9FLAO|nr:hypothetical protein [Brumimicrobium glaciale]RYM34844.1 hypothetical protein ERX46_05570 [Brumimicrobium glaciale]
MDVHFDIVRIGEIRKNFLAEKLLKQNLISLKDNIVRFFKEYTDKDLKVIHLIVIIPGKGYVVSVDAENIKDSLMKIDFINAFSNFIYKGRSSTIDQNMHNRVF